MHLLCPPVIEVRVLRDASLARSLEKGLMEGIFVARVFYPH